MLIKGILGYSLLLLGPLVVMVKCSDFRLGWEVRQVEMGLRLRKDTGLRIWVRTEAVIHGVLGWSSVRSPG